VGGALCEADLQPIGAIQGPGDRSPFLERTATVAGIVTLVTGNGFYIESLTPDDDPATSEGLFLAESRRERQPRPGAPVRARGRVAELGERRDTQTALVDLEAVAVCDDGSGTKRDLPATRTQLPLGSDRREALESMRITLDSRSLVSGVYRLRDGDFLVAADGPLAIPTEVARPGRDARQVRSRNRERLLPVRLAAEDRAVFAVGAELLSDEGVLGHDGFGQRLLLEAPARLAPRHRAEAPPREPGTPRIVSLNLLNYFNGDGRGGGFPAPRGARSLDEFEAQRARLRAAFELLQPDLLAVMELENDGFGADSAAEDLREDLERATGVSWRMVDPGMGRLGTDQIAVGLLFRPDRFEALGGPAVLDAAPFDLLSRTPLAQAFEHSASGRRFTVVVNHFKSKGSCPEQGRNQDQDDGQGCWNAARTAAARALAPWVHSLAKATDGRALILGDLNAYRLEDPVRELVDAGFRDLTGSAGPGHRYSYVYRGQSGTLDHALATPALAREVSLAQILNVNSPYPPGVTSNAFRDAPWLRSSDHDPVLVEFRFSQSATRD
jgi:predicted extracellular nuclease